MPWSATLREVADELEQQELDDMIDRVVAGNFTAIQIFQRDVESFVVESLN